MHALVSGNSELTRLLDLLEHRFSELVEDISRTREELSA
jgi:hypothetical protein